MPLKNALFLLLSHWQVRRCNHSFSLLFKEWYLEVKDRALMQMVIPHLKCNACLLDIFNSDKKCCIQIRLEMHLVNNSKIPQRRSCECFGFVLVFPWQEACWDTISPETCPLVWCYTLVRLARTCVKQLAAQGPGRRTMCVRASACSSVSSLVAWVWAPTESRREQLLKKEFVLEVLVCFILFWGTKMCSCCLLDLKWRWSGLSPVGLEICHQSMFLLINLFGDPVDVWDNVQKRHCYIPAYQLLHLSNSETCIHNGDFLCLFFCLFVFIYWFCKFQLYRHC